MRESGVARLAYGAWGPSYLSCSSECHGTCKGPLTSRYLRSLSPWELHANENFQSFVTLVVKQDMAWTSLNKLDNTHDRQDGPAALPPIDPQDMVNFIASNMMGPESLA